MTTYEFRFRAPLRGFKAVQVHSHGCTDPNVIARIAIRKAAEAYGFGMYKMRGYDGLDCIGITDGVRTIGWGGLLTGGRKLAVVR